MRTYDSCVSRVHEAEATRKFNETLIQIIDEEIPGRADIGSRLRAAMVPELDIASCGTEPTFLTTKKA